MRRPTTTDVALTTRDWARLTGIFLVAYALGFCTGVGFLMTFALTARLTGH